MAAAIISPFLEHREVPNQNRRMLNYSLGGPLLTPVPCSSANLSSRPPTATLLDRKVVGAGGPFQRHHSVGLPSAKLSQSQYVSGLKTVPSTLFGSNNKENRFRERSCSALGERLRASVGAQPCVAGSSPVNSSRYKTELCRPYEENGACKYADKCQFAHGIHELRSMSRHPKYKTALCRTFHSIGFCPYGPRCHFVHKEEEQRRPPPLSAFNKMARPRLQHSFSFAGFPSSGGLRERPTSVTPPPMFSGEGLAEWQSNAFAYSSQELATLLGTSSGPPPASEPQGPAPPSPPLPCILQPTPESPPSPPDSVSDQEGYQSSQSGSESPLLDASHRLPIFSRLSISDD